MISPCNCSTLSGEDRDLVASIKLLCKFTIVSSDSIGFILRIFYLFVPTV